MVLVQIFIFWPLYKQLGRPNEATFGTLFWPLYILNRGFRTKITVPGYSCAHSCISKFRSQYLNLCRYFRIRYRYLHPVPDKYPGTSQVPYYY